MRTWPSAIMEVRTMARRPLQPSSRPRGLKRSVASTVTTPEGALGLATPLSRLRQQDPRPSSRHQRTARPAVGPLTVLETNSVQEDTATDYLRRTEAFLERVRVRGLVVSGLPDLEASLVTIMSDRHARRWVVAGERRQVAGCPALDAATPPRPLGQVPADSEDSPGMALADAGGHQGAIGLGGCGVLGGSHPPATQG